jgi:hypothetical protein
MIIAKVDEIGIIGKCIKVDSYDEAIDYMKTIVLESVGEITDDEIEEIEESYFYRNTIEGWTLQLIDIG